MQTINPIIKNICNYFLELFAFLFTNKYSLLNASYFCVKVENVVNNLELMDQRKYYIKKQTFAIPQLRLHYKIKLQMFYPGFYYQVGRRMVYALLLWIIYLAGLQYSQRLCMVR